MKPAYLREIALLYLEPDVWLSCLEISCMDDRLRTKSLHSLMARMVDRGFAKRRRNSRTKRWEYSLNGARAGIA